MTTKDHHAWLGLASRSPRRLQLLRDAGFGVAVIDAGVDDSEIDLPARHPAKTAMALAWLKAAAGAERAPALCRVVLGADTFVVKDGCIIGKPDDADDARRIVRLLTNGEHEVLTGVAVVVRSDGINARRQLFCDTARVRVGTVSDFDLERYIESGDWSGKAGAYNFAERVRAGWPLECDGDPTTVMGLPMRQLTPILNKLRDDAAAPCEAANG